MAGATGLALILGIPLGLVALAYLLLTGWLLLECLLALLPPAAPAAAEALGAFKFAVLMPAHNEAAIIHNTLTRLLPEVADPAQILVVADNCQDETAAIARRTGVTVLERQDEQRRGKGYALDYGLKALAAQGLDVVVMVDADCWVTPGTVQRIAQAAGQSGQPVQAVYVMESPPEPSLRDRVSAFALTVKNRVRASGLSRLGAPIMLGGTGMAFPWGALQAVELASGHIVEDMKLGMDLAIAGYTTTLSLDAQVTGILPHDAAAATSQRTRWEHGHLQVLKAYVPRLVGQAVRQRRLDLLLLAVDLAIPPLALWSLVGLGVTALAGAIALLGLTPWPLYLQLVADGLLLGSILLCWLVWGRKTLAFSQLLAIPLYMLWKVPIYLKAFLNPQKSWIRTKRDL